jgi:hypothetical protein
MIHCILPFIAIVFQLHFQIRHEHADRRLVHGDNFPQEALALVLDHLYRLQSLHSPIHLLLRLQVVRRLAPFLTSPLIVKDDKNCASRCAMG